MSHYSIYPVYIDYMTCRTCGTEAFSWLAESFSCPICGIDDYAAPQDMITEYALSALSSEEEIQRELAKQRQEEVHRHLAKMYDSEAVRHMCGRKRKRPLSDVGGRR